MDTYQASDGLFCNSEWALADIHLNSGWQQKTDFPTADCKEESPSACLDAVVVTSHHCIKVFPTASRLARDRLNHIQRSPHPSTLQGPPTLNSDALPPQAFLGKDRLSMPCLHCLSRAPATDILVCKGLPATAA